MNNTTIELTALNTFFQAYYDVLDEMVNQFEDVGLDNSTIYFEMTDSYFDIKDTEWLNMTACEKLDYAEKIFMAAMDFINEFDSFAEFAYILINDHDLYMAYNNLIDII